MIWTRSPTWAWAALARWRPSAIVLPCRAFRDPAMTPTSRPPPCPPSRIWAGRASSESPRLGGGAGVAQRGGGQSRTGGGEGELAGQPGVPLLGDGVLDGGRAEQKGAAHGDGEHQ